MRIATVAVVSLLVAGCAHATVGQPEQAQTAGAESAQQSNVPPLSTTSTQAPPRAGAPISAVISWIEAGGPADAAGYHHATRADETTDLGDDIAFTTPAGSSRATICMTDSRHTGGALACLVDLADPPRRPEAVYGEGKGGWVDFDGTALQVGTAHGDPGPFRYGAGPELPNGATLSFGDYRCRTDQADLFCVNYAHRSAVRLGPAGVEPFGCLNAVPPPADAGNLFQC